MRNSWSTSANASAWALPQRAGCQSWVLPWRWAARAGRCRPRRPRSRRGSRCRVAGVPLLRLAERHDVAGLVVAGALGGLGAGEARGSSTVATSASSPSVPSRSSASADGVGELPAGLGGSGRGRACRARSSGDSLAKSWAMKACGFAVALFDDAPAPGVERGERRLRVALPAWPRPPRGSGCWSGGRSSRGRRSACRASWSWPKLRPAST